MIKIGLTGGLGTGKTTVLKLFAQAGMAVLDADHLAHHALEPGQEAYKKSIMSFGKEILRPDRTIDRSKLAAVVFRNPKLLAKLNGIVHPPVKRQIKYFLRECGKWNVDMCAVSVPLLYETRMEKWFDKVVAVKVSRDKVVQRVEASRGMSRADILARIKAQMPVAEKCRRADFVLNNNGSLKHLRSQVKGLLKKITICEV